MRCSVEEMVGIVSDGYSIVFANYVLEHVRDLDKASREICRVLFPSGVFVATIPNPVALEFLLARITPVWFHKIIRKSVTWETYYSYRSIAKLVKLFSKNGLELQHVKYWSSTLAYLDKYPFVKYLSKIYDQIVNKFRIKCLMGNVYIEFRKKS